MSNRGASASRPLGRDQLFGTSSQSARRAGAQKALGTLAIILSKFEKKAIKDNL